MNHARPSFAAIGVLSLMALTAAGCNSTPDSAPLSRNTTIIVPARTGESTVTSAEMPAGTVPVSNTNAGPGGATGTQAGIADRINAAIVHNTQMTGSRVTALVDSSGVATLNGFVQNGQQKALAEKAARDTAGVSSLKDKLEIRPTGGAGKTKTVVLTALPDGSGAPATAPPTAQTAVPAPAPTPRVVVVNNYVPVPQQPAAAAPANPPTVNVNVTPADNSGTGNVDYGTNGGGNDNRSYPNPNNGGQNFTGDDADYSNPAYSNYGYRDNYRYSRGAAGLLNRDFVPDYLRNMNSANQYNNYLNDLNNNGGIR